MNKKLNFDVNTLVNEVNKCDKSFGIRLKHHDYFDEPQQLFDISCSNAEIYIAKIITVLNGISLENYFCTNEEYGTVSGPIGPENIEFTELSSLEWEKNNKYDIKSLMFKCRFLTMYLQFIMHKLDVIAKNRSINGKSRFGVYEHSYFYLKNIISDVKKLVLCMLTSDEYSNILLINLMHSSYLKKKGKPRKFNHRLNKAITELKNGTKSLAFINEEFMSDDLIIYSVLRIAYMLCSNDTDCSVIPEFRFIEGATREHNLSCLIRSLGESILIHQKYSKRPVMYRAFNAAEPLIMTDFVDVNDDYHLSIGIRALAYTDFILNDKKLHKFINKMINTGKLN